MNFNETLLKIVILAAMRILIFIIGKAGDYAPLTHEEILTPA
jgi:hypothetical protein